MSKALAVQHDIPSPTIVVADDLVTECEQLAAKAEDFETVGADNLEEASDVVRAIARQEKAVEQGRVDAKRRPLQFGREVDAIARKAKSPLTKAKQALATKIAAYQRQVETERREAIEAANAEVRARVDDEARERAEMAEVFGEGAQLPETPPVEMTLVAVPEKIQGTGVYTQKRKRLVIYDADAVPQSVAGRSLRVIDEAAVEALLRADIEVPGARLEEYEITGVRG